jgi:hypothetical protein
MPITISRRYRHRRCAVLCSAGHGARLSRARCCPIASWVGCRGGRLLPLSGARCPTRRTTRRDDTCRHRRLRRRIVFLVALIVISFITVRIADFIIDSRIGALDRTLGFLFGAARGILLARRRHAVLQLAGRMSAAAAGLGQPPSKSKPLLDTLGSRLAGRSCRKMPMRRSSIACPHQPVRKVHRPRAARKTRMRPPAPRAKALARRPAEETPATNG